MSAHSCRRLLLAGALVCLGAFLLWLLLPLLGEAVPAFAKWGVIGTPLTFFFYLDDKTSVPANNAVFLGLLLLAQWIFLRPVRRAMLPGAGAVRPRWHAIASVAWVVTLLCSGLAATLLELGDGWKAALDASSRFGRPIWITMLAIWAVWTVVFWVYFRRGDFLGKAEVVVRALIRGSCLELLIAIPIHAFVYRRNGDDCYCGRGSYTGLVFGGAVLVWAFGPGLVLLLWREKQRREPILQRLCPQCGAALDPAAPPGSSCPQCGRTSGT